MGRDCFQVSEWDKVYPKSIADDVKNNDKIETGFLQNMIKLYNFAKVGFQNKIMRGI